MSKSAWLNGIVLATGIVMGDVFASQIVCKWEGETGESDNGKIGIYPYKEVAEEIQGFERIMSNQLKDADVLKIEKDR
jgi:hypothetical protein